MEEKGWNCKLRKCLQEFNGCMFLLLILPWVTPQLWSSLVTSLHQKKNWCVYVDTFFLVIKWIHHLWDKLSLKITRNRVLCRFKFIFSCMDLWPPYHFVQQFCNITKALYVSGKSSTWRDAVGKNILNF